MLCVCDSSHFTPTEVHLKNNEINENTVLNVQTSQFTTEKKKLDIVTPAAALSVKDEFFISDRAYHEIRLLSSNLLPSQHELKQLTEVLNSESTVTQTPNEIRGVQQSLKDRLTRWKC